MLKTDGKIAKKAAKRLIKDNTKKISTKKQVKRGEHYKYKSAKAATIAFDRIVLSNRANMPRNGWKNTYFVSAFFITIMIAVLGVGLLFVDLRTNSFGWGTQITALAFSSHSKGVENITVMGKSFTFDLSMLNPVNNVLTRLSKMYLAVEPASFQAVRMFISIVWQGIEWVGDWIVGLI